MAPLTACSPKTGPKPKQRPNAAYPAAEARSALGTTLTSASLRYSSSAPSSAPPSGARNTAPTPAARPITTAVRAWAGVSRARRAKTEPKAAEIWAAGPSVPAEPPEPMVSAEATIFTIVTRPRMLSGAWCAAAMAASVPCPPASGASQRTRAAAARAPPATTSGTAHGRSKEDATSKPPSTVVRYG